MQNDRTINVAIAGSRKSTHWPATTLRWSEFCERLSRPIRSQESYETYLILKKSEQDDLKDVGGFVGGTFRNARRKATNVLGRDIISLDLDSCPAESTDLILQRIDGLGCGFCVYSTRKHHPAAPRLRVLIPLDRTVTAEEYEPIARKMAEIIGIELADPTTFEASRLMYWPSVSADGVYVYKMGDKPFLLADGVLAMYQDWRCVHEWPQVPGAHEAIQRRAEKQQDPEEKPGVIGAFCRAYDIPTAINKFLLDAYIEDEAHPGRYTFAGGSTTGGAVVYDDGKFLFSHHATDPTSGQLVNSFDLVRLHKFSSWDDDAKDGTPVNKLPSFVAMQKLALEDESVKSILHQDRQEASIEAFKSLTGQEYVEAGEDSGEWMQELKVSSSGNIAKTAHNVYIILNNDANLKGKIAYDEFSNRGLVLGPLPWNNETKKRDWSDADDAGLRQYLELVYDVTGERKINDALMNASRLHSFNDVKSYLNSLVWDGINRIDTVLIDYFGADDNAYTRAATRKFFAAAAARVFQPGIKWDYMPILTGPQGCGKSTFVARIGKYWYSDSLTTFDDHKKAAELIQGVWINEIGELNGMTRSEVNNVKQFLSKTDDIYREAYGRRTIRASRSCVFIGTTNDSEFLRDRTGNRRFWPIDLHPSRARFDFFEDFTSDLIGQLWAEALIAWRQGEKLYLTGEAAEIALEQQEAHLETNPKAGIIQKYLSIPIPVTWDSMSISERKMYLNDGFEIEIGEVLPRQRVCAAEIYVECLGGDIKRMQRRDSNEIVQIMDTMPGWKKLKSTARFGDPYGIQRGYERDENFAPESCKPAGAKMRKLVNQEKTAFVNEKTNVNRA